MRAWGPGQKIKETEKKKKKSVHEIARDQGLQQASQKKWVGTVVDFLGGESRKRKGQGQENRGLPAMLSCLSSQNRPIFHDLREVLPAW